MRRLLALVRMLASPAASKRFIVGMGKPPEIRGLFCLGAML